MEVLQVRHGHSLGYKLADKAKLISMISMIGGGLGLDLLHSDGIIIGLKV